MATPYYVDVMIRMGDIIHDLHGRLLYLVHKIIIEEKIQLVVSWPDMKATEFGFVFRVFGPDETLKKFVLSCQPMVTREMIRVYPISETPPHAKADHYFARDRSVEKQTPGYLNRENERCKRRGVQVKTNANILQEPKKSPYLPLQSGSTEKRFSIYIKKVSGMAPESSGGNNYGLGLTVPIF